MGSRCPRVLAGNVFSQVKSLPSNVHVRRSCSNLNSPRFIFERGSLFWAYTGVLKDPEEEWGPDDETMLQAFEISQKLRQSETSTVRTRTFQYGACIKCQRAMHLAVNSDTNQPFLSCNGFRNKSCFFTKSWPVEWELPLYFRKRVKVNF